MPRRASHRTARADSGQGCRIPTAARRPARHRAPARLCAWLSSRTRRSLSSAREASDRAPRTRRSSADPHGTSRCTTSRPRRSRPRCSTSPTARSSPASSDIIGGSDISVVEGSHVVVITAGAKQNPGQTRIELAGVNARILKSMMPQLLEVAPNAIYVIVTNPCDVLTVLAQEETGPSARAHLRLGHGARHLAAAVEARRARRGVDLERPRLHRRRARRHRVPAVVEGDDRHGADPRMGDRAVTRA